jgi:hypothetical protein
MTPSALAAELVEIVADVCNCHAMWSQHQGPVTIDEAAKIAARIERYMEVMCAKASANAP